MIDVKIIKKPKNDGGSSGLITGATAYGSMAVKEAAHAAKADIAGYADESAWAKESAHALRTDEAGHADTADVAHTLSADSPVLGEFLSKTKPDTARELITFLKGIKIGEDKAAVDENGNARFTATTSDSIRSAGEFVDGLLGSGFRLWKDEEGKTRLTIDRLTVRETWVVLEMLIEKVRAIGGQLVVSAGGGRVKKVTDEGDAYHLTFETENTFREGDLIRCKRPGVDYWVRVAESDAEGVTIPKTEFGAVLPGEGDDCVLMGSATDPRRRNLILISATEDGQPRIDVLDGVSRKNFNGALRARLGNLDGIRDDRFPADAQPRGNGIYADNAFLRGTFVLSSGEDVKTLFEITDGKVRSAVDAIRQDSAEEGVLANSAFVKGMVGWQTDNEAAFFVVGDKWIWDGDGFLSQKGDMAVAVRDEGRTAVFIRNRYILQRNTDMLRHPVFEVGEDGHPVPKPFYLSFFYKVIRTGRLEVAFENAVGGDFVPFSVSQDLMITDGYRQFTHTGLWNGTGDFRLSFTGEIYIGMIVLSDDRVEGLAYRYRTLFAQSERLVRLSAAVYDKDERLLQESGLLVRPEGSGIYVQTADGKLGLIGVAVEENGKTVVKLTADNIVLDGLVPRLLSKNVLAEGAEIAGWVFRNGRLESENGSAYLNGEDGTMRLRGTAQFSTGYSGNFSDVNLFYLPARTTVYNISMGAEMEDIGKVCRLYNDSAIGSDGVYKVSICRFANPIDEESGGGFSSYGAYVTVNPQEVVEMTCFEVPVSLLKKDMGAELSQENWRCGIWRETNRYTINEWRTEGARGRYPLMLFMGRLMGGESPTFTGDFYDGRPSPFTVSRLETGIYKVTFEKGVLPSGYKVFATGYGSVMKAGVDNYTDTSFVIVISDDASLNDGNAEVMIMDSKWWKNYSAVQ